MRKLRKSKRKKLFGINYVCNNCGIIELIPSEVLKEFDKTYPDQLRYGYHQLKCEKFKVGIMQPE